jgi:hypothetical protein
VRAFIVVTSSSRVSADDEIRAVAFERLHRAGRALEN